jgi:hypothetical protein
MKEGRRATDCASIKKKVYTRKNKKTKAVKKGEKENTFPFFYEGMKCRRLKIVVC